MGFQDDWVLRQVEMIAAFVGQVVFHHKTVKYEIINKDELSSTDILYLKIQSLLKEGKICQAEDMLFDNIEYNDRYVELATDFYQKLNKLTVKELEQCNFSKEEIYDGFLDILEKLKIPVEQFKQ